jgi:DNA invertase Pin-like site-specific DNA recombinase
VPDRYDDGGFSGGSMERPALERMLRDIDAGKIDCVVVYKVDRLSRSLMDFSRIMDAFERSGVSFVSVTQQFNTTHSMGRLTLNILLSFAQFEREIIGERIRDKIAAQKRKGKWAQVVCDTLAGLHRGEDRREAFSMASSSSSRHAAREADALVDRDDLERNATALGVEALAQQIVPREVPAESNGHVADRERVRPTLVVVTPCGRP